MFCETKDLSRDALKALGLSFNPFKAVVAPRPIGWVTTIDSKGVVNLAPYSFFNAVSSDPPMVFYGANGTHEADGGEKGFAAQCARKRRVRMQYGDLGPAPPDE